MKASIHGTLQLMLALAASLGPIGQSFANAQSGGVGTGGGMFMPGTKVTVEQVEGAIKSAAPYLRAHLHFLELILPVTSGGLYGGIGAKMFGGKINAIEIFEKAKVRTEATGPCLDRDHQPRNGSVDKDGSLGYCISAKDATEVLTTDNLFPQIVAISMHELGHLAGLDETEAQTLQRFTLIFANSATAYSVESIQRRFREQLSEASKRLKELESAKEESDICSAIESLSAFTGYLAAGHTQQSDMGILLNRHRGWLEGATLNSRARMLFHFCMRNGVRTSNVKFSDLYNSEAPAYKGLSMTIVGNGDRKGLAAGIKELRESVTRVEAALNTFAEFKEAK
jgi:hypothetical protein